jgi:hypothetical protein
MAERKMVEALDPMPLQCIAIMVAVVSPLTAHILLH